MANAVIFPEQSIRLTWNSTFGAFCNIVSPPTFYLGLGEGSVYDVAWGADTFPNCVVQDARAAFAALVELPIEYIQSANAIGNLADFGGTGNGEPFIIAYVKLSDNPELGSVEVNYFISLTAQSATEINVRIDAVYEPEEPEVEPSIVLKDLNGEDNTYADVEKVELNNTDGETVIFSKGEVMDEPLQINLDFTNGNQTVEAPEGYLVKRAIIVKPETLIPENIAKDVTVAGIVGTHSGGGGSGDAVVWFVTFIGADGSELYKMPVLDGDDCKDPITHGDITTPTKQADAQYTYTYSGWSATADGSASSSILNSITEDKTVYAAFTGALRYYTITYYDTDGTTVLATESLAYGTATSRYEPTKSGYKFSGWIPEFVPVTGDASYTASWVEALTFARGAWVDIVAAVEEGTAQEYFAVGDTRTQMITHKDGTSEEITLTIVGFNADTLASGSGTATMTIMSNVLATARRLDSSTFDSWYYNQEIDTFLSGIMNNFPTALSGAIKSVKKTYNYASSSGSTSTSKNWKMWLPRRAEVHSNFTGHYEYFGTQSAIGYKTDGTPAEYWTRDGHKSSTTGQYYYIDAAGGYSSYKLGTLVSGVRFGFCI